jgi:hypothetical protein
LLAAFMHPFPFRGQRAPLLWVFYRLVSQFGRDIVFLLSRDYLDSPDDYQAAGRWELSQHAQGVLGYRTPTRAELDALRVEIVPDEWTASMTSRFGASPLDPWRHFLLSRDAQLEDWISTALRRRQAMLGESFDAVLIWNNCVALKAAVQGLGLPLLHWELGPLRTPQFRPTAYLDRQSVNGGTESETRLRAAHERGELDLMPGLDRAALEELFRTTSPVEPTAEFELGAALQVDDDSNLIAYSNGHDNASLLAHALHRCSEPSRLLVRNHPGRRIELPAGEFAVDRSAGSIPFIQRCESIVTINSGLGAEALLLGRRVESLGDSPYAHIARLATGSPEWLAALRFFLLNYLVPWSLLFDPGYIRWRLGNPPEPDLAARHLAAYRAAEAEAGSPAGAA